VAESTQDGSDADHVEALVASEGQNDGSHRGGGRRGDVAEAEVLPEGVVAGNGAPESANAGGDAEGRPVEAFQDLSEDVGVVVYAELGFFLFLLCFLLLHGFGLAVAMARLGLLVHYCVQVERERAVRGYCIVLYIGVMCRVLGFCRSKKWGLKDLTRERAEFSKYFLHPLL
jgi:hypothetical protein